MQNYYRRGRVGGMAAGLLAQFIVIAAPARAETLSEALQAARARHPRIEGARSRALAAKEGVAQAKAAFMPTIAAHGTAGASSDPNDPTLSRSRLTNSIGYDVLLTQPLYDGGRTSSAVGVAKASEAAEGETARQTEHQTLLAGVTAFVDVITGRRLIGINERNTALLERVAEAARRQLAAREGTKADVAQAEAALAGARAQLEAARGDNSGNEAVFADVLLHPPGRLEPPPSLAHLLPDSRDSALAQGERENSDVVIAHARLTAATHAIEQARAGARPSISLQAGYERVPAPFADTDGRGGAVVRVVGTIPIYTGGLAQAQERAALHSHAAAAYQVADTRSQVRTAVAQAWSRMIAARAALGSVKAQQASSRIAFDGIAAERKLGQRTMTEQIIAQQAMLSAETALEQTTRNLYVSTCTVLMLTGRFDTATISDAIRKAPRPATVSRIAPSPMTAAASTLTVGSAWTTSVREARR